MKRKFLFILFLIYSFNFIFSTPKSLCIIQSEKYELNKNVTLKINIYSIDSNPYTTQKIIKIYKKNIFGLWTEKGSLESIKLEEGDIGEGFQDCWIEGNKIYIQQSFGDGKFLIISKLVFEYNDEIKLIKYIENHIDRFSEDKDFSDIQFPIPDNISFNEVNSEFVYKMHKHQYVR